MCLAKWYVCLTVQLWQLTVASSGSPRHSSYQGCELHLALDTPRSYQCTSNSSCLWEIYSVNSTGIMPFYLISELWPSVTLVETWFPPRTSPPLEPSCHISEDQEGRWASSGFFIAALNNFPPVFLHKSLLSRHSDYLAMPLSTHPHYCFLSSCKDFSFPKHSGF